MLLRVLSDHRLLDTLFYSAMAPQELADVLERVRGSLYRWTPAMKLPCHGWNLLAYLRALADLYTSRHINRVLHFPYREY